MKSVYAILYEPASYTTDRNEAVYDKLGIKYCYMHGTSLAKSESDQPIDLLPNVFFSLISRLKYILKHNDVIIMNGYVGRVFLILYFLNFWYRRSIGLDSDTQLVIPGNPIKKMLKTLYLKLVFGNKHFYGLAGGTKTHKELFRHFGMKEERIFLCPMMVDNEKFRYGSEHKTDIFKFLYVGRIISVKNIELMIKAFLKTFSNRNNVELHIVGGGELLDVYQKQYTENNVIFEGPKYGNDLVNAYKLANVFILPSSFEPWGLVVNEAMSAGLPCLVSDQVGAAWDLVEDRNTGYIFKNNDMDDLSMRMLQIYEDKELYFEFSRNAYETMHNYWNYELYTKNLINFIEKA